MLKIDLLSAIENSKKFEFLILVVVVMDNKFLQNEEIRILKGKHIINKIEFIKRYYSNNLEYKTNNHVESIQEIFLTDKNNLADMISAITNNYTARKDKYSFNEL